MDIDYFRTMTPNILVGGPNGISKRVVSTGGKLLPRALMLILLEMCDEPRKRQNISLGLQKK